MPAEQTVWPLLGVALMQDQPIIAVARQLDVALPGADGSRTVASSALTQARSRLGPEPMEIARIRCKGANIDPTKEEAGHAPPRPAVGISPCDHELVVVVR